MVGGVRIYKLGQRSPRNLGMTCFGAARPWVKDRLEVPSMGRTVVRVASTIGGVEARLAGERRSAVASYGECGAHRPSTGESTGRNYWCGFAHGKRGESTLLVGWLPFRWVTVQRRLWLSQGAGRRLALSAVARDFKEFEIYHDCTLAAPRITGEFNAAAGAIPLRCPGGWSRPFSHSPVEW